MFALSVQAGGRVHTAAPIFMGAIVTDPNCYLLLWVARAASQTSLDREALSDRTEARQNRLRTFHLGVHSSAIFALRAWKGSAEVGHMMRGRRLRSVRVGAFGWRQYQRLDKLVSVTSSIEAMSKKHVFTTCAQWFNSSGARAMGMNAARNLRHRGYRVTTAGRRRSHNRGPTGCGSLLQVSSWRPQTGYRSISDQNRSSEYQGLSPAHPLATSLPLTLRRPPCCS